LKELLISSLLQLEDDDLSNLAQLTSAIGKIGLNKFHVFIKHVICFGFIEGLPKSHAITIPIVALSPI
jgi:hypothetical protein